MIHLKKKDLNQNIHFSEGNIKSVSDNNISFLTWSLPSKVTCPYATEMCKSKCFAKKRELNFSSVLNSRMRNYEESKKDSFINDVIKHLEYQLQRKKNQDKLVIIRIHTSGDFYNIEYFNKWVGVTNHFKDDNKILFQAYTKSMPILKEYMDKINKDLKHNENEQEYFNIINDVNIHFVWSIWKDTNVKYTEFAQRIGLQTFTALPKNEIEKAKSDGKFICNGNCAKCLQCYKGKKDVVIKYH